MQADRKAGSQFLNPSSGIDHDTKEIMIDIPDETPPRIFSIRTRMATGSTTSSKHLRLLSKKINGIDLFVIR